MIQIDPDEDILKILDIDWSQVQHIKYGLANRLAGFEEYEDKGQTREHMYPLMILENMTEAGCVPEDENLSDEDKILVGTLKEIRELCDKHDCSYFRIINSPITRQ